MAPSVWQKPGRKQRTEAQLLSFVFLLNLQTVALLSYENNSGGGGALGFLRTFSLYYIMLEHK